MQQTNRYGNFVGFRFSGAVSHIFPLCQNLWVKVRSGQVISLVLQISKIKSASRPNRHPERGTHRGDIAPASTILFYIWEEKKNVLKETCMAKSFWNCSAGYD